MDVMNRKFNEDTYKEVEKLYNENNTCAAISKLTGISIPYIKNILHKRGIKLRPSGFQKGNQIGKGRIVSDRERKTISQKHKLNGHKPTKEAVLKGQPKTIQVRWGKHKKDPIHKLMYTYIRGAKDRNIKFNLTRNEFENIIFKNCYYCGEPPSERIIGRCSLICNGVDRAQNNNGYFIENCVPCCKICNVMKMKQNKDEFISQCIKITKKFLG